MKTNVLVLYMCGACLGPSMAESTPFGTAEVTSGIFCDMPSISGNFSLPEARYTATGVCVKVTAEQNKPRGSSQFDDYNHSHEDYRVQWTAEAGYNPATKDTWETITAPAPGINEPSPPGRPYGRFISKMICSQDPWLNNIGAQCVSVSSQATGNLGKDLAESMKRGGYRPFTSFPKGAQRDALIAAKLKEDKRKGDVRVTEVRTNDSGAGKFQVVTAEAPRIVEPKPSSTHSPQTAMKILVAAPKIYDPRNFKVQTYELQFHSKQKDGTWKFVTSDIVAAGDAEGAGYFGWGAHKPGSPPQMMATAGTYRVRAVIHDPTQLKRPELGVGEWVEYVIAGTPGHDMQVSPVTSDTAKLNGARADVYSGALAQPAAKAGAKTRVAPAATQAIAPAAANEPVSTFRR